MYGAASQLSNFGTVAGWPIFILTVIITANGFFPSLSSFFVLVPPPFSFAHFALCPFFFRALHFLLAVWGALLGEWKGSHWKERWIMIGALVIMGGAIVTIGFSAQ